jgi:hypothetical protein
MRPSRVVIIAFRMLDEFRSVPIAPIKDKRGCAATADTGTRREIILLKKREAAGLLTNE